MKIFQDFLKTWSYIHAKRRNNPGHSGNGRQAHQIQGPVWHRRSSDVLFQSSSSDRAGRPQIKNQKNDIKKWSSPKSCSISLSAQEKNSNFRIADTVEKVKKKRGFFPVCNSIKGINFRTGIRNAISEKDYTDKK